jgi:phospholipid/cholesterol/gamma-HCH transport system ATP-binding protein
MRPWGNKSSEPAATQADATAGRPGTDAAGRPRQWVAPGEPIISLLGVTKSFGSHTVLEDVSFDIPKGRTTAILGPSGTGKSVLLKNILGLLTPDRGQIWVDGDQIVGMRERRLYDVRKKFGVLFQDGALFGSMTLYDNIAFPLREHTRKSEREIREVVLRNAELVGLLSHLKKLPGEVSGGMKKRAGLARAMVTDPEIVLFDEPDSGLDPVRVAYLDELVRTAQRETGATFFVITHNIDSVNRIADYMGILFRSRLVKFASKEEMLACDNPVIQQFLAGRPEGPIGMDEMADDTEPAGRGGAAAAPAPARVGRSAGAVGGPPGEAAAGDARRSTVNGNGAAHGGSPVAGGAHLTGNGTGPGRTGPGPGGAGSGQGEAVIADRDPAVMRPAARNGMSADGGNRHP